MAAKAKQTTEKSVEEKPFINDSWSMPRLVAYFAPDRKIDYDKLKKDLIFLSAEKIAALLKKLSKYADDQFWLFLAVSLKTIQDAMMRQALNDRYTYLGTSESIEKGTLISEEELNADEKKPGENKSQKEDPAPQQEKPSSEKESQPEESQEPEDKKAHHNMGGPYTKGFFDKPIIDVAFDLPKGLTPDNLDGWLLFVEKVYFEDHICPAKSGRKVTFKLGALRPGDPHEGKELYNSLSELRHKVTRALKEEAAAAAKSRQGTGKHKAVSTEEPEADFEDTLIDTWEEKEQESVSDEEWDAADEEVEEESSVQNEAQKEESTQAKEMENGRKQKTTEEDEMAEPVLRDKSPVKKDPVHSTPQSSSSQQADHDHSWKEQPDKKARKTKEEKNQCLKSRPPSKPPAT